MFVFRSTNELSTEEKKKEEKAIDALMKLLS